MSKLTGVELLGIYCLSHVLACKINKRTNTFILLCNFINFILFLYFIVHIVTVFFCMQINRQTYFRPVPQAVGSLWSDTGLVAWVRILVQVTIYRRLLIGRDSHLDQSEAYDIS